MGIERLRRIVTLGALVLALVHIIWPQLAVDGVTLTLIALAVLPWLAPLFKSLELPGGWKVEFQDLQKAAARADDAGLLSAPSEDQKINQYSFQTVADSDPNLALAGLRIEIEKRLVQLAQHHGVGTKMQGLGRLMLELSKHDTLTGEERSVLSDMLGLLNAAVHGATVDPRATQWAMEIGPRLIQSLEEKLR